ncbi:SDR family oxidoreductase [Oleiagrimonas soli]|uniref:NAD-dependent dehydratase n=1 Tax=Oleiagrimonas soli TaxID=1543381 RepID=A0A099D0N4_9GAMM|nr:SDR family oxidoreductase [Oleiagrimonas soli]KGI78850.1 NAD-dependent dehydratase [Oleiagrimonas soli]MBB6184355.1 nucleoside-diphosphate-sugar epimerase [Oleiagrimonas soli]
MRVFVTGATGFIGSALVKELIAAGHQVLGLCRSEAKAPALREAGAEVHPGTLEDLDSLRAGASDTDAVVHLAFNHDFSRYVANCEDDRRVIATLGETLIGSKRPLIVTSGTGMARNADGKPATERDDPVDAGTVPRAASEEAATTLVERGVNASIMRLPQVHDTRHQGLMTYAIEVARQKGVFAYVGDGSQRWPAAHVSDVARLYRLALEHAQPGARYHAVAEEGVSMRAMADIVGPRLDLPVRSITQEEAAEHFGWLAGFAGLDLAASSVLTREALNWHPSGPGMLADLALLELPAD